jgi:hypothetical protein
MRADLIETVRIVGPLGVDEINHSVVEGVHLSGKRLYGTAVFSVESVRIEAWYPMARRWLDL